MVKKVDKKMFVKPKLKKAMKPDKLKSALKSDKIKSAMKPDKIMTALKPDKVKLAVKPVKVKSAMKPDKVKKAMKPDKVKSAMKSDKVKSAMKPDKFKIPSPDIDEKKKEKVIKKKKSETSSKKKPKTSDQKASDEEKNLKRKKAKLKIIEKEVDGKVAFFNKKRNFGYIRKNDAKDGDENIYFRDKVEIYVPDLEVQFDVAETEKGPRAVDVKILDTPENQVLKANAEKAPNPEKKKEKEHPVEAPKDKEDIVIEKNVQGKVIFTKPGKFGFIKSNDDNDDDKKIFFRCNKKDFKVGAEVEFDLTATKKGIRAVNVKIAVGGDLVEKNILGKIISYRKKTKLGKVKRKDVMVGEKPLYFKQHIQEYKRFLKVEFDVKILDKGVRAVNLKVLEDQDGDDSEIDEDKEVGEGDPGDFGGGFDDFDSEGSDEEEKVDDTDDSDALEESDDEDNDGASYLFKTKG